jgi:hypothetical protein
VEVWKVRMVRAAEADYMALSSEKVCEMEERKDVP